MVLVVKRITLPLVLLCMVLGLTGCKESSKDSKNVTVAHKSEKKTEAKASSGKKDKNKAKKEAGHKSDAKKKKAHTKGKAVEPKKKVVLYDNDNDDSIGEIAFLDTLSTQTLEKRAAVAQQEIARLIALLEEETKNSGLDAADQTYKTIFFEPKSAEVNENQITAFAENIANAAKAAKEGKKVVVRGHGDKLEADYAEAVALELAEKRAKLVKNELVKAGAPENNVEIAALGTTEQLVFNLDFKDQDQNMYNRRVEILTV